MFFFDPFDAFPRKRRTLLCTTVSVSIIMNIVRLSRNSGISEWKKRPDMLSEGNAAHPVGCDSTLQTVMAVWQPFCLNSNFLCPEWQPSADNNGAPKGHCYLQRLSHPTGLLSWIVCRGQECHKGRKGILRPDLLANTRPRIFFKKPMTPQDTGRQLWGTPGIVSLKIHKHEIWILNLFLT